MPRLLIFFLTLVMVSSCTKENSEFTNFDLVDRSETILKTALEINSPVEVYSKEIEVKDSALIGHKTKKHLIEEVQLNELRLIILSPSSKTFDFARDVEVFISAKDMPEKKIASLYGLPDNVSNQITLNADKVNVKNYLTKGKYQFKLRVLNDKSYNQPIKVMIASKFVVDAKKSKH